MIDIATITYSLLQGTVLMFLLLGVFSFWGRLCLQIIGAKELLEEYSPLSYLPVIMGVALIIAVLYAFARISPNLFQAGTYFFTLVALLSYAYSLIAQRQWKSINRSTIIKMAPVIVIVLSAEVIFMLFQSTDLSRLQHILYNNDIYYWMLSSDTMRGLPGFSNIHGTESVLWSLPGQGTTVLLAYITTITGNQSLFDINWCFLFLGILFMISIFDLAKKQYANSDIASLLISIIIFLSGLFQFVFWNGFMAQIFAFACISGLCTALSEKNLRLKIIFLIFMLTFVFLIYPHGGAIVYIAIAIAIAGSMMLIKMESLSLRSIVLQGVTLFLFPLVVALALTAVFTPVRWSDILMFLTYGGVVAGWSLPALDFFILLGAPLNPSANATSLLHLGSSLPAIATLALITLLLITLCLFSKNKKENFFLILPYFLFLVVYFIYFHVAGGKYQSWKFATFCIVPLLVALYTVIAKNVFLSRFTHTRWFHLLLCVAVSGVLVADRFYIKKSLQKIETMTTQLLALELPSNTKNIVLELAYGMNLLAANIFAPKYKVYTLTPSYIPVTSQDHPILTSPDTAYVAANTGVFSPLEGDAFTVSKRPQRPLLKGFSTKEPWGTWTDGNTAIIQDDVPEHLSGKNIQARFNLHAFLGQSIQVFVNDQLRDEITIGQPQEYIVPISRTETEKGSFSIRFEIPGAKSPAELGMSGDARKLGLGFTKMVVEEQTTVK